MIELKTNNNNINFSTPTTKGDNGASAYEVAVNNGFEGTEQEWLESLKGKDGISKRNIKSVFITNDWENGVIGSGFLGGSDIFFTSFIELPADINIIDIGIMYNGNNYLIGDLVINLLTDYNTNLIAFRKPVYDEMYGGYMCGILLECNTECDLFQRVLIGDTEAVSGFTVYYEGVIEDAE